MKKALAGPAKRTAKKKPERRVMIAAARRRLRAALAVAVKRAGGAARKAGVVVGRAARVAAPRLRWAARKTVPPLRWAGARLFRALAVGERWLRRAGGVAWRAARWAAARVTAERAFGALILASAAALLVSQFLDYRAVEIGQPGYAGLPAASPPTVAARTAGQAHSYLLIAPALLAAALAVVALRRRRPRLGRLVFALGLLSLAVVLLVDLPAGLDAGIQATRYSGADAILESGFYLELAATVGLIAGGLLLADAPKLAARYHARPCRTRISSFAKGVSALRRRRRRPASRPGRGARRASPRRSGGESARASRP